MTRLIGPEALIHNPSMAVFKAVIGTWTTTGTHPMVPGTTFHGRTSFNWHEGGAFVVMRSEIDEPQSPSGIAIFGSDDALESISMLYFNERLVHECHPTARRRAETGYTRRDRCAYPVPSTCDANYGVASRRPGRLHCAATRNDSETNQSRDHECVGTRLRHCVTRGRLIECRIVCVRPEEIGLL